MQAPADEKFLIRHVSILRASYRHWLDKDLIDPPATGPEAAVKVLDHAPFAVVSHGLEADPVFNYANQAALELFEMPWHDFIALPSRLSAGPPERGERAMLLERVARDGYIDDYSGLRVSGRGRRFRITNATVWNLLDETGRHYGQAAMIPQWSEYLDSGK